MNKARTVPPRAYWRAFWGTAAMFGTVNVALFAYYLALPIQLLPSSGKSDQETCLRRKPFEAFDSVVFCLNLPGVIVAAMIVRHGALSEPLLLLCVQVFGTLFAGGLALIVERFLGAPAPSCRCADQH
jgi:hypothetical protein